MVYNHYSKTWSTWFYLHTFPIWVMLYVYNFFHRFFTDTQLSFFHWQLAKQQKAINQEDSMKKFCTLGFFLHIWRESLHFWRQQNLDHFQTYTKIWGKFWAILRQILHQIEIHLQSITPKIAPNEKYLIFFLIFFIFKDLFI